MKAAICTLFENHYHYGLAALVNSLVKVGYEGPVFAGYRGELPPWANQKEVHSVGRQVEIHFIRVETTTFLANYKPEFMRWLIKGPCATSKSLFFFDSDIVVTRNWSFFEHWISAGIAACEDVNSPLSEYHPKRVFWRDFFGRQAIKMTFKESTYVNTGFIGLRQDAYSFIDKWWFMLQCVAPLVGGLGRSPMAGNIGEDERDRVELEYFFFSDQDAFNAALETWPGPVSIIGKEGMGFIPGKNMMNHALGSPKPWKKNFLAFCLNGEVPTRADRAYWQVAGYPIAGESEAKIKYKRAIINLAILIGRFYRRN